jgi:hypothetical protein
VVKESRDRVATYEQTDSVREQVMVAVHDTVMEVTTITVREAANGDTLRVSTVTDRLNARSRDNIANSRMKTEVRVDTVFIEKRDSSFVENSKMTSPTSRASPLVVTLKWVFWIIIGMIGLVAVVRIRGMP